MFSGAWVNFLKIAAVLKLMIAGVGVGLAALGLLDVAFAVTAEAWWDSIRPDWVINLFAAVGAIGAVATRVVSVA